jgi:hypothetical protein
MRLNLTPMGFGVVVVAARLSRPKAAGGGPGLRPKFGHKKRGHDVPFLCPESKSHFCGVHYIQLIS